MPPAPRPFLDCSSLQLFDQPKAVQIIALTKRLDTSGRESENRETAKRNIRKDEMERVAECHCGQLRAIKSGEADSVYVCHCKACQRRTGAVIHNGSRWLKSQVQIEGEHKIYGRIADSGFEIRFHVMICSGLPVHLPRDSQSNRREKQNQAKMAPRGAARRLKRRARRGAGLMLPA